MLDMTFVLLLVLAIILLLVGIRYEGEHDYWNILSILFSAVIFIALAFAVMDIEIPYQFYNATSGNAETGYQVHGTDYSLQFLFAGIGIVESIYVMILMFMAMGIISEETFRGKYKRKYRRRY